MAAKDSVLAMLAQNIPAHQISATLGVEESYISQLASNEDFQLQLAELKIEVAQADINYDAKLDLVEESFLDRIEDKSKFANLQQSIQAFKVLNTARRRRDSRIQAPNTSTAAVIQLTVAVAVIPQYQVNSKNEIIEVEGKTMVSATPSKLDEIIATRGGTAKTAESQPGITKVERAAGILQTIENKPQRKLSHRIPSNVELSVDIL